ncbi:IS1167, transposase, partial [Streptococcus equinus ATCC 9812]
MKSDQTIIRKYLMEQINNTTELIGIKDNNITIQKALDGGSHREIYAKLDYTPPLCPHFQGTMIKYD